ncbi:lipocalin family protein [Pinibacter soli]|uniref:Lipocalin family protein n=1 Tax=Pinibacter soli TaxID=3044211 RepID=A0ABT6REA9_9BACT|nr:lipocalin family protein [Pinibacter soli]MDI3320917.1 lipocalin family protein [Pinibacter soli]
MTHNLLIIAIITTLFSCSKPGGDAFNKEYLTNGKWKLTALQTDYNKDGFYEEDTYSMYAPCQKDNIYTFQADGTLIADEGPVKCSSGDPQSLTSTWSFTDNQTRIRLSGINYQIEELTPTTFRVKGRMSYNYIYTIDEELTYTKQ